MSIDCCTAGAAAARAAARRAAANAGSATFIADVGSGTQTCLLVYYAVCTVCGKRHETVDCLSIRLIYLLIQPGGPCVSLMFLIF